MKCSIFVDHCFLYFPASHNVTSHVNGLDNYLDDCAQSEESRNILQSDTSTQSEDKNLCNGSEASSATSCDYKHKKGVIKKVNALLNRLLRSLNG